MDARRIRHIETAQRIVKNLFLDGQYGRAAKANDLITGILRSWAIQKSGGRFNKGVLKIKRSKK